ncbi:MAG: hypothetical protein ACPHY8_06690 [Patescibacteria group bacterium]
MDDYLTKPFEVEELVMRLRSILKRGEIKIDTKKIHKNVEINFTKKKVYFENNEIIFSNKLYLIIEFLMKNI